MSLRDPIEPLRHGPEEAPRVEAAESSASTKDILDALALDRESGWERLIRRVESKLRILLHFRMPARLRDALDEEDLLQEVWADAARNLERFEYRGPGSLQRWLAGILANKLLHAGRELGRLPVPESVVAPRFALAALARGRLELAEGHPACAQRTQSSPSELARRRELEQRVRAVLLSLPEVEREAILLKLFEGLSGREAADRLGVDESTISVRFRRALEACAVQLKEHAP